uniref:Uncharacterized protein n=1 Tax=Panagrolaimus sp. ES5 TaxID=591445 RepID=A0AC34FPR5_9BILA
MKRRQEFDDEEMLDEKHPRRSPLIGSPVRNENIGPNENVVADVNPNIYADYLKLDESYADLECKYSEAMSRLAAYEQTEYEDEEAVNNATEAINETKKKADKVEAEIANVAKKIETVESLNKNLNDTVAVLQKANEKIKKDAEEEATSLQNQINDLQHHLE